MTWTAQPLLDTMGITISDPILLKTAFHHKSYLNEYQGGDILSNEKLEFLGDSVLSLITSHYLYTHYINHNEGEYTDIKAAIVRTESLAEAAAQLGLGDLLFLSKGEEDNGGRTQKSLLADCFEALLAVIYLDKGYDVAASFVEKFLFGDRLEEIVTEKLYMPSKNILQEYYQGIRKQLPEYRIETEEGPQHDKTYTISVYAEGTLIGSGTGKSKKEAEEEAARAALQRLNL